MKAYLEFYQHKSWRFTYSFTVRLDNGTSKRGVKLEDQIKIFTAIIETLVNDGDLFFLCEDDAHHSRPTIKRLNIEFKKIKRKRGFFDGGTAFHGWLLYGQLSSPNQEKRKLLEAILSIRGVSVCIVTSYPLDESPKILDECINHLETGKHGFYFECCLYDDFMRIYSNQRPEGDVKQKIIRVLDEHGIATLPPNDG